MKKEILNVEKNDRREYVSLSVKVVDIHLSDCINSSDKYQPININKGDYQSTNFTGNVNYGTWDDSSN